MRHCRQFRMMHFARRKLPLKSRAADFSKIYNFSRLQKIRVKKKNNLPRGKLILPKFPKMLIDFL
jgi:hypothetical protein